MACSQAQTPSGFIAASCQPLVPPSGRVTCYHVSAPGHLPKSLSTHILGGSRGPGAGADEGRQQG